MTVWGKSTVVPESALLVNTAIMCPGIFYTGSAWRLRSIEVYIQGTKSTDELRLAVYRGGFGANDTAGTLLVEDLFLTNAGSAHDQWWSVNSSTRPLFNSGEQIWLAFKGVGGTFPIAYDEVSASRGNLSAAGTYDISLYYDPDHLAPWPDEIFDTFTPLARWYNIRINVDVHASVTSSLTFAATAAGRSKATVSCASSLTFALTSAPGPQLRATSSLTFTATAATGQGATSSAQSSLTFSTSTTHPGSPRPCWGAEACHRHAIHSTGRTTCALSDGLGGPP